MGSERLKIGDLSPGDRVAVTWYREQVAPVVGAVVSVIRHASRASGTYIRTDAGQYVRLKASMRIVRASPCS
jgi:hypothetical protein